MKKIKTRNKKLIIFCRITGVCLLIYTIVVISFFLVYNTVQFFGETQEVSNMNVYEDFEDIEDSNTPINNSFNEISSLNKYEVDNPFHMLVNSKILIDENYVPKQLYKPNVKFATNEDVDKNYMEYEAGKALEKLFEKAITEEIDLIAVSGYRSYKRQVQLYNNAIEKDGPNQINTAKPGSSEHQTGLAMDINMLEEEFGETVAGKWVAENAHTFGFIIRYPKDKVHITGITYEPWHLRYVGEDLAKFCYENNLTLEEVYDLTIRTPVGVN